MDREKLFRHLEKRYTSKREMLARIPLGMPPESLWQDLLNQRRSVSTVLPLYNFKGLPYWFVTTDKMVTASEKIVEALFENETESDPYLEPVPVSTLEEVFYTSYVEGTQISIQDAMDFLAGGNPPRDVEEQLIANNRQAGSYAGTNLYRPIDSDFLRELIYLLTDGLENGGQDFRDSAPTDLSTTASEAFEFPSVRSIPDRLNELCAFLESPQIHPLLKAGVAQAYLLILRPFQEGNERLGRMLSNILLLRAGYAFFGDVSLSALIARRSYAYYEAMANILREENGCDMTYFLEFFLELLARAVEERRLRISQREEQNRKTELEMARTSLSPPLAPAALPQPEKRDEAANQHDRESEPAAEGGEIIAGFLPVSMTKQEPWSESPMELKPFLQELQLDRIRRELYVLSASKGELSRLLAGQLLRFMENGTETFTATDIAEGCSVSQMQASNMVRHLRPSGLIESCDKKRNGYRLYQFNTHYPLLRKEDYDPALLNAVETLRLSDKSHKDRRIGEVIAACLPSGLITSKHPTYGGDVERMSSDMILPEQMGIIDRVSAGEYSINRHLVSRTPALSTTQKHVLTRLYRNFGSSSFTLEMAMAAMDQTKSHICMTLHKFSVLRILDRKKEEFYEYRLLVDPLNHPSLFVKDETDTAKTDTAEPAPVPIQRQGMYSENVYRLLNTLASSQSSSRDRRVGESLQLCLEKGTLLRSDYDAMGHSVHMWIRDTAFAVQLGLIAKQPDGSYLINRDLSSEMPALEPHQKKTITAIYEAFGDQEFSQEMFLATLNYSASYTYASLRKLTLLRILEQKTTEDGSQYQLLVNPEEHPECFDLAA